MVSILYKRQPGGVIRTRPPSAASGTRGGRAKRSQRALTCIPALYLSSVTSALSPRLLEGTEETLLNSAIIRVSLVFRTLKDKFKLFR